jgi:hypothetical protein
LLVAYTATPYATPQQVYNALGLSPDTQATDASWIADDLIPQAQAAIDTYVGYPFQSDGTVSVPTQRLFSGNDAPLLVVDPIQQITQVLEVSTDAYINYGGAGMVQLSYQTVDVTSDIEIGPDNMTPGFTLQRASTLPFFYGKQNYKVSGVWGYAAVPAAITRACIRLVAHWYKMRDYNYAASTGSQQYGIQKHETGEFPSDICRILDQYRFPIFAAW